MYQEESYLRRKELFDHLKAQWEHVTWPDFSGDVLEKDKQPFRYDLKEFFPRIEDITHPTYPGRSKVDATEASIFVNEIGDVLDRWMPRILKSLQSRGLTDMAIDLYAEEIRYMQENGATANHLVRMMTKRGSEMLDICSASQTTGGSESFYVLAETLENMARLQEVVTVSLSMFVPDYVAMAKFTEPAYPMIAGFLEKNLIPVLGGALADHPDGLQRPQTDTQSKKKQFRAIGRDVTVQYGTGLKLLAQTASAEMVRNIVFAAQESIGETLQFCKTGYEVSNAFGSHEVLSPDTVSVAGFYAESLKALVKTQRPGVIERFAFEHARKVADFVLHPQKKDYDSYFLTYESSLTLAEKSPDKGRRFANNDGTRGICDLLKHHAPYEAAFMTLAVRDTVCGKKEKTAMLVFDPYDQRNAKPLGTIIPVYNADKTVQGDIVLVFGDAPEDLKPKGDAQENFETLQAMTVNGQTLLAYFNRRGRTDLAEEGLKDMLDEKARLLGEAFAQRKFKARAAYENIRLQPKGGLALNG